MSDNEFPLIAKLTIAGDESSALEAYMDHRSSEQVLMLLSHKWFALLRNKKNIFELVKKKVMR